MTTLTDPKAIDLYKLKCLEGAMKMEAVGLKKRGTSATMICKNLLGLSKGMPRVKVQEAMAAHIEQAEKAMGLIPCPTAQLPPEMPQSCSKGQGV